MSSENFIEDINIDNIGEGKTSDKILDGIVEPFNKAIRRLLKLIVTYDVTRNEHIERVRMLIVWAKEYPSLMIMKCYKNLTNPQNKEALISKDIKYFCQKNYSKHIKKDIYKNTIDFMLGYIKKHFNLLSDEEKEHVWELIWIMAICSESYKNYLQKYQNR